MKRIIFWLILSVFISSVPACAQTQPQPSNTSPELIKIADFVLDLLQIADFKSLISIVHPTKGLNFSPYARELSKLPVVKFSKEKLSNFQKDRNLYIWGRYDGSGFPIKLTPMDYYKRFIYDIDYKSKAQKIFISNSHLKDMDTFKALNDTYPNSSLVLFHFKGTEENEFIDFKDLILIFSKIKNQFYLEGIAHSENTV